MKFWKYIIFILLIQSTLNVGASLYATGEKMEYYPFQNQINKVKDYNFNDTSAKSISNIDLGSPILEKEKQFSESISLKGNEYYNRDINEINVNKEIIARNNNALIDILDFQNSFYADLERYIPSDYNISRQENDILIENYNCLYDKSIDIPLNKQILKDDHLIFDILTLHSSYTIDDFAYKLLELTFNTFSVSFIFESTDNFFSLLQNSSSTLYIVLKSTTIDYSINSLSLLANSSIPTEIQDIRWKTYSKNIYTFYFDIKDFSIYQTISNYTFNVNNNEFNLGKYYYINDTRINISIKSNLWVNFTLTIIVYSNYSIYPTFKKTNNSLIAYYNILFSDNYFYNEIIIYFPNCFIATEYKNNLTGKYSPVIGNQLVVEEKEYTMKSTIDYGNLNLEIDNEILQGVNYNIEINDTNLINFFLVHNELQQLGNLSINSISFTFPQYWPQGKSFIVLIDDHLNFYLYELFLPNYPSEVLLHEQIKIDSLNENFILFELRNLTSHEIIHPEKIKSYYQNFSLRNSGEDTFLKFLPDEFDLGPNKLFLILSRDGFVDHNITLSFNVVVEYPKIKYQSTRYNNTCAVVFLKFDSDIKKSLLHISILNNNTNTIDWKSENMSFKITNMNWDNLEQKIQLLVIFGQRSGSIKMDIKIPEIGISNSNLTSTGKIVLSIAFLIFCYIAIRKKFTSTKYVKIEF